MTEMVKWSQCNNRWADQRNKLMMCYELKPVINTLIKYHESVYEINPRKAEDGLNEIIDVFDEYTEVIRMLIENN